MKAFRSPISPTAIMEGLPGSTPERAAALGGNIADANKSVIGIGTNFAPQITKTYKDAADAEIAGSGLFWKLGTDLAKAYIGKTRR